MTISIKSHFVFFVVLLLFASTSSCSLFNKSQKQAKQEQEPEEELVEEVKKEIVWLDIEEAVARSEEKPKKIIIDLYTDWCHWCKVMDKNTFTNDVIIDLVNEHYYPVKLNGEAKDTLSFQDKEYVFYKKPGSNRGFHELAYALTGGRLSYPTIVFLDEESKVLQPIPGYKKPTDMEAILTYFGKGHHKTAIWKEFLETFESQLPPAAE